MANLTPEEGISLLHALEEKFGWVGTNFQRSDVAAFAETGENPVSECWLEPEGQGEDGNDVSLSLQWSVKVIY